MNQKALIILEYYKIINLLEERASSLPGKDLCRLLLPKTDLKEISLDQANTRDALNRLMKKGGLSFGGNKPVSSSLSSLEIGSCLSAVELLTIAGLLENANRVKTYGRREREDSPRDTLDNLFDAIEPLTFLSQEIRRCILSEEEFADDASSALKHLRRQKLLTNEKIHNQLNSLVNGSCRTYLQDAVVTM
ncbi:MAG: endonuclease MutS2, partial [Lachnospiraceae bacterium]